MRGAKGEVLVIGSGASGVHFALSLLRKGYRVRMLDVGYDAPPPVSPGKTFKELIRDLEDPVDYLLGGGFEGVLDPRDDGRYYAFPPTKGHVFRDIRRRGYEGRRFSPLVSYARGGLAEVWTAGVYPFDDRELAPFGLSYKEMEPAYTEVASRIGVCGEEDDLARFMPMHGGLMPPLRLDRHSQRILERYQQRRGELQRRLCFYLGRSRIAALSRERDSRQACAYLGRCFWGCPIGSIYTPSLTLAECSRYPGFEYISGVFVRHLKIDQANRVSGVVAEFLDAGQVQEFRADRYVLAAGTLNSARIFAESVWQRTGEAVRLAGLMDNRQVLVPFINLEMLGRACEPESYQYHQLAFGLEVAGGQVHGQITTLKNTVVHAVIQKLPVGMKAGLALFRNLRSAMGVANLNFPDTRREACFATLVQDGESDRPVWTIQYEPAADEPARIGQAVDRVARALRRLRCLVPPGMVHVRPMGSAVHYAGLIPVSDRPRSLTVSRDGRSHDFDNLFIVDGTIFPALPAKNITFTLMANAVRIADAAF